MKTQHPDRRAIWGPCRYGTKDAALEFLPNGRVRLVRSSRSLAHDWKSQTKGLHALKDSKGNGAPLDSVVFDLANVSPAANPHTLLSALQEIVSTSDENARRLLKEFCAKVKAARRIRGVSKEAPPHNQTFMDALHKLARKLGRPPTKGELAKALNLENNKAELSRLCRETRFDWLRTDKPGPAPRKRSKQG
jgi:hypothetical protein